MYKNLVIIVVTFMAVFSCKKEENKTSVYTNYISSSMKPYMFKANSYWVYENDSTHVLDSIFVTNVQQGFFNEPPTAPSSTTRNKNEYYKMTLHDNLSSKTYVDFMFSSLITRNGNEYPEFGQPIFLHKYSQGSKVYGTQVISTDTSITVNSNIFNHVEIMKVIKIEQRQWEFGNDTYLFYKDSIGLVKKVIDDGNGNMQSWNLKRWKVNL